MTFISKKAIPRRTVLRGIGASLAMPLLGAMVPAMTATAQTAASPVPRLGFFYAPNGMFLPNFHPEGDGGRDYQITPILRPLEAYREQMVVVSGLSNSSIVSPNEGGGVHTRAHGGWLSGVLPKRTEGADVVAGKTVDQYAADVLGKDTSLRSLELTSETNYTVGNCENGYSCTYQNSTSWRTPTTPLPHERDPRVVFQRLFGGGGSVEARVAQMKTDRSILDSVTDSINRLERKLGPGDRVVVDEYLSAVREIEQRIQRTEQNNIATPLPSVKQPAGVPESYEEHIDMLFEMLALAYQADVTRVSCFQMARELSGRTYPNIGVPEAHHSVSHHQLNTHNIEQYTRINAHHVSLFSKFIDRLHNTQDGDGSLLDHSIMMYGTGMGDGDHHTPYNLPVILVGGGRGQLQGGRHMKYPLHTPFMNLGLSLLDKVGVELPSLADSSGRLSDL
ncbi:MAG: hypothetical protein COB20_12445 [SAR86 cluster bacterium]|uniref:DUF1552 domain-containing protein n=1 Tax=SAR86 cluster bacterium TaxID=2030880 RepID=A0A2A4WZV7_9GAMM|nr:MAG: hypothetical protein COB20_12445 [SAR86 cluster bacterium]